MKRTMLATALMVAAAMTPVPPATAGHHPNAGMTCGLAAAHNFTGFLSWDGVLTLGPVVVDPPAGSIFVQCSVQTTPTPGFGVVAVVGFGVAANAMPPVPTVVGFGGAPPFYVCTWIQWMPPVTVYEDDADHAAGGVQCPRATVTFSTLSKPPRPIVHVEG